MLCSMANLTGKVALITGAKGGLGTSVTHAFLNAGARVAGVSRSIRDSDFNHANFFAVPGELSSSQAAKGVVDAVLARAGGVDVVAHLVGGFAGGSPVTDTDDSTLDEMIELNLKSGFYIFKAALPHMRAAKAGRLIAVSGRAAIEASPNVAAYSASKAAMVALVRAIASEEASHGISANCVLPGTMDTARNREAMPGADFTKWVRPEQVAALIVSLASDELSQVTGASIPVYGSDL